MAGYSGYSMSNNAVNAYAEGKMPLSKVTRAVLDEYGILISVPMFKWLCETARVIKPCEWHHTGLYFNETYFYDLPAISRTLSRWNDHKHSEMETAYHEWRKSQPRKVKKTVDTTLRYAYVSYSMVRGTPKKHRRRYYNAYAVIHNGWAYCVTEEGKVLDGRKKVSGSHFSVDE